MISDFTKAADLLCGKEGVASGICEVSVTFESEDGIRELNAKYRGIDAATDVLSFPMYGSKAELLDEIETLTEEVDGADGSEMIDGPEGSEEAVISLGDVVICTEIAKKQAAEYGHSEQREMVYLFVHSLLHLFGYDHEDDGERAQMREAEEEIMQQIGLSR